MVRYRAEGAAGLVSRHRGRRPNNQIADALRQEILDLVRSRYADFGPTLACEKLAKLHDHKISVETLRQWMIADDLWKPKARKQARIHQRRPRRPCRGELMALRFAPAETTQSYMETLRGYLAEHGRPVALYPDKHSIFRVNHPDREGELTQFTRAPGTLDIEPIHANTPQAKGRVERANQTLQDHLVKELRLAGISDIDAANAFLPDFLSNYNQRFAVPPQNPTDAHRLVLHDPQELALIFSPHAHRKLSKNLTLQYKNREYQLTGQGKGYRLRGAQITVCEAFDGSVTLLYQGRALPYRILNEGEPPIPLDDEKSIHATVGKAKTIQLNRRAHRPAPDHPWR